MNNKDGLDEMQRERHNMIGNQMFTIMTLALLVNVTLYSGGIRWLHHPTDTMVIVLACSAIYIVRVIIAGAYKQARITKNKTTILILIISVALSVALVINFQNLPVGIVESTNDYSSYILLSVSGTGLIAVGIASIIKKKQDGNDKDD